MLRLMKCEVLKLKRRPLAPLSLLLAALMPLAYTLFLSDARTSADAVSGVMSSLFQVGAYLFLLPLLVILAVSLLFEEADCGVLKNLAAIPVSRTMLAISKLLILLLFSLCFMAAGGAASLALLLFQGWEPEGFWTLFFVGLGEGIIMWAGALPCILLVVILNKSYIVSVMTAFFYTVANYILAMNDHFLTQPFGLNAGTLLPGPLAFRWTFQFYSQSQVSGEMAELLERLGPYFLSWAQVSCIVILETAVFLALTAAAYGRQEL